MFERRNKNEILHDIYQELAKEKRFDVSNIKVILPTHDKKNILSILYNFIYENYYLYDHFKWRYSFELFEYFVKNAMIIMFYLPDTKNNMVLCGIVIGKPIYVIHETNYDFLITSKCMDVNFLCVKRGIRGNNICNFMLNNLMKSTIEHDYSINGALFTIGSNKKYNKYSEKSYYFKILNKDKVINSGFMEYLESKDITITNVQNKNLQVLVYKKLDLNEELKKMIHDEFEKMDKIKYKIYEQNSLDDILSNQAFTKIFLLMDGKIVGFVILYNLNLQFKGIDIKNVFIYKYFTCGIDEKELFLCIDNVCVDEGVDMITSNFQYDKHYIKSILKLNYYEINLCLKNIESNKNGLITI